MYINYNAMPFQSIERVRIYHYYKSSMSTCYILSGVFFSNGNLVIAKMKADFTDIQPTRCYSTSQ